LTLFFIFGDSSVQIYTLVFSILCSTSQQLLFAKMSMSVKEAQHPRPGFPRPFPNTPESVFDQLKLTNRVAVVSGAADGIGLAVAEAYAEAGANVALWYNS
jgi:hypothetical protein